MFRDSKMRQFEGVIVLPTAVRLKKIGIDLGGDLPKTLDGIKDDPELLGNVLYIVHESSVKSHGMTEEDFGQILDGNVLPAAVDSLIDAIINFSQPGIRPALRSLVSKGEEVQRLTTLRAIQAIDEMTPEMILSTLSGSVGNSPESLESIPAKEHSENFT